MMAITEILDESHEPSAWLRDAEGRRLHQLAAAEAFGFGSGDVLTGLLGELPARGSDDDRRCDRCTTVVAVDEAFHAFLTQPRPGVRLIGGFCGGCLALELGGDRRG